MLLRSALSMARASALVGRPGLARCGAAPATGRFLASDASRGPGKPAGGDATDSSSSTKWFWGFVLVPCILLPALFIEGDVQDIKSGRIQRKNTTWY